MSILNNNGSASNGIVISIGIHIAILTMIVFSGKIKQLPIIEEMIESRTDANLKKLGEAEGRAEIEDVVVTYNEKKIVKAKVLKTPKKIKAVVKKDPLPEVKSEIKVEKKKEVAETKKPSMVTATEIPQDMQKVEEIKDQTKLAEDNQEDLQKDPVDESVPRDDKYIENPNSYEKKGKVAGFIDGFQDGKKLKQVKGNIKPAYPTQARLRKEEGTVLLKYFVDQDGYVSNVRLERSSGFPELDDEAINKLEKWKFYPGQSGDTMHSVAFQLKGDTQKLKSRLRTSR